MGVILEEPVLAPLLLDALIVLEGEEAGEDVCTGQERHIAERVEEPDEQHCVLGHDQLQHDLVDDDLEGVNDAPEEHERLAKKDVHEERGSEHRRREHDVELGTVGVQALHEGTDDLAGNVGGESGRVERGDNDAVAEGMLVEGDLDVIEGVLV